MTRGDRARSRFARAVVAVYERRTAQYRVGGLSPDAAHARALDEAKQAAREALTQLTRMGCFPWTESGIFEDAIRRLGFEPEEAGHA